MVYRLSLLLCCSRKFERGELPPKKQADAVKSDKWSKYILRYEVSGSVWSTYPPPNNAVYLCVLEKDMGERKIHMQKPLFKALESLTLRMIGPHFLLYATEDIAAQYRR